ncbi:hypothetical protein Dsin_030852 [Dipteronia sinensis]|uniref:Uncharacterized protein n=1 Tax=Dipteronia sinensis TaxID=43782 RepID=A0AAD9ZKA9_9ROSI|nr:hypothetical protein Dsin_030852 [Dipteronia sinensis]
MQGDNSNSSTTDSAVSFCPSFNSYSSDNLVDIATRVSRESVAVVEDSQQRNNDDDDFEFVSLRTDPDECEFFFDGQIRQVYPLFNRDLLLNEEHRHVLEEEIRFPLKKLFIDDRDGPPSSSSSEADELEGVPEETYCAWTPRTNSTDLASPNRCEKSNSTGSSSTSSSKRWLKFRDLLKRSNSEGKDPYVFLNKPKTNGDSKEKKVVKKTGKQVSAHEAFYVKNRAIKEGDKKRSYLPYRRDLVGFFANVNGLG